MCKKGQLELEAMLVPPANAGTNAPANVGNCPAQTQNQSAPNQGSMNLLERLQARDFLSIPKLPDALNDTNWIFWKARM